MEMKKLSYDELDGKAAMLKSEIFALNFKVKKIQEEISRRESALKKLREVKWQKVCEDMKVQIIDSDVDFSIDDLQKFLQVKKVDTKKTSKPKKKNNATNLKE